MPWTTDRILVIPAKPDVERDAVASARTAAGGSIERLDPGLNGNDPRAALPCLDAATHARPRR
jgi:hypothetical protein